MREPKYKMGEEVNCILTLINKYYPATIEDIRIRGWFFKRYEYFVANKESRIVEWVEEDRLFVF